MSKFQIVADLHENFIKSNRAVEYMVNRGISLDTCKQFYVGYGKSIPCKEIDHLYGDKIIFPFQYNGTFYFTSRNLGKGRRHLHQYGRIPCAYNQSENSRYVILTEGPIDCLTLKEHGFAAIGLLGVNRFPFSLISDLKNKKVFICFDKEPNRSGDKAAKRIASKLKKYEISSYIIDLPYQEKKTDINSYMTKNNNFIHLMNHAKKYDGPPATKRHPQVFNKENIVKVAMKHMHVIKSGSYYKSICPFHQDSEASLVFYEDSNTAYCFGCGKYVTVNDIRNFFND